MNWISYIFGILLVILTGVLIWWEYRLKYHFEDGRTLAHKKWRKRVLWITLALFILNQINSFFRDRQSKAERVQLTAQIRTLNENQTNLMSNFAEERKSLTTQITNLTIQINTINSNQLTLLQQHHRLLDELTTNSSISLDLRQRILDSSKEFEIIDSQVGDLNAWANNVKNKISAMRIEAKLNQERADLAMLSKYKTNIIYYQYAVTALTDKLRNVATLKSDSVVSDYKGIPSSISLDIGQANIAEIKLQTNSNWDFKLFFKSKEGDGRRHLVIQSEKVSLEISADVSANAINTYIHLPTGETITKEHTPIENYKKAIDESVEGLIGVVLEQSDRVEK